MSNCVSKGMPPYLNIMYSMSCKVITKVEKLLIQVNLKMSKRNECDLGST